MTTFNTLTIHRKTYVFILGYSTNRKQGQRKSKSLSRHTFEGFELFGEF